MSYVPHTQQERSEMLAAIGVARMEDLFADVPAQVRFPALKLPPAASELEIMREMQTLVARNFAADPSSSFLGAGTYHHFRPAIVDYVLSRGEFYTSYTQYQPEVSQGMLQALFEYQSMICRLTDMDVSNASHYDGATALAEAALLALNVAAGKRSKIVLSPAVHPQYRTVVRADARGDHRRRRRRCGRFRPAQGAARSEHRCAGHPEPQLLWSMRADRRPCRGGPSRRRSAHRGN
jgi:glycine dehydrogenase subunit 1